MLGGNFFIARDLRCQFLLKLFAFMAPLLEVLLALGGDLQVTLHLLLNFLLVLGVLREEHLPAAHVVHGLVFVGHQVALDHRRVLHSELQTVDLGLLLPRDFSQ
jgi:hypothetical protein